MPADRIADPSPFHNIDEQPTIHSKPNRKRGKPGACDHCKRKKVRCDSAVVLGNICSNCIAAGFECTHEDALKTLRNMREYIKVLEERLKNMNELLNKAMPGFNSTTAGTEPVQEETEIGSNVSPIARNDDDLDDLTVKLLNLRLNPKQNHFLGKSSGHQLIQTALEVKDEYIGKEGLQKKDKVWTCKRPEFWAIPSWWVPHSEAEVSPLYNFPESDLLISLVGLYFTHLNIYLPLLHRPTFERSLQEKEHHRDRTFGATVMLVCALGSQFSNDPRVFVEGSGSTTSAGWKWYRQVNVLRRPAHQRTSLYELQMFALSVMYGQTSPTTDDIWIQVGMGLRLAQQVGAHRRRKTQDGCPNAENELWKRAFWVLVCLDRFLSSSSGRPCAIQQEDFDLDFPVDCDDEYWDQGFTQPLGKPSMMTFFVFYLKLMNILVYAMRVVYPIKQTKNLFGEVVHRSEQEIIAELDSAMNNWMYSIPVHLRWNPSSCKDEPLSRQSATLHASYYDLQIFIHRPFLPSPRNPRPGTLPSLSICANAARLCCRVLDYYSESNTALIMQNQVAAMHSGVVLLINIWSGKKSELVPNPQRDLEDVHKVLKLLRAAEQRWYSAGRYFDIVTELACAGELPLLMSSQSISVDHSRWDFSRYSSSPTQYPATSVITPESANSISSSDGSLDSLRASAQPFISFPVYTKELGRLPVYEQFDFTNMVPVQRPNYSPFPVEVIREENHDHNFDRSFSTGTPLGFTENISQDLFKTNFAFFSDQMTNSVPMFYSPPATLPHYGGTNAEGLSSNDLGFRDPLPFFDISDAGFYQRTA